MHWNADPILIQLGPLAIRWYGALFAAAFLAGLQVMRRVYQHEGRASERLDDLLLYMMIGTVIGARLGHVLFYDPNYYFAHPIAILKIWEGGLASHGGTIGVLIAVYLYCRRFQPGEFIWLLDRLTLPSALAASFVRLGNFFNSEIIGTPTELPWGIVFERVDGYARHPVQLYESITYLAVFGLLVWLYTRTTLKQRSGAMLGVFLSVVFAARFLLEFVKTKQAAYEAGFAISVGQWLSLPFVVVGLVLWVRAMRQARG